MLKFLGFLMVVGLAFVLGVYVGRQGPEDVFHKAKQLGAEVVTKTSTVERNLTLRTSLVNAKERLVQAKSDLLDKNYGKATGGLEEAAQALAKAKDSAGDDLRGTVERVQEKVAALKTDAQALKQNVQAKVDELVKELDQMLAR